MDADTTGDSYNIDKIPIALNYEQCLALFGRLTRLLKIESTLKLLPDLSDELGRFKSWGAETGAQLSSSAGRSSLDYRLRKASHIHLQITLLLAELHRDLEEGIQVAGFNAGISPPPENKPTSISYIFSNPTAKLGAIISDIAHVNSSLYRLSSDIRYPAPLNQLRRFASPTLYKFKNDDVQFVRNEFPKAPGYLVERLGLANTKRRQLLGYFGISHDQNKRSRGLGGLEPALNLEHDIQDVNQDPTRYQSKKQTLGDSSSNIHPISDPRKLLASTRTMAPDNSQDHTLGIPPMSADIRGKIIYRRPFMCPCCLIEIYIGHEHAWRDHILEDLQAYVCTFENCPIPGRLFENKDDWYHHETQFHRKEWYCCICAEVHTSEQSFSLHFEENHYLLTISQWSNYKSAKILQSERALSITDQECVLCLHWVPSLQLKQHLSQHLEEVALLGLQDMLSLQDTRSEEEGNRIRMQRQEVLKLRGKRKEKEDLQSAWELDNYDPLRESDNYDPLRESDNYDPLRESDNYDPLRESDNRDPLTALVLYSSSLAKFLGYLDTPYEVLKLRQVCRFYNFVLLKKSVYGSFLHRHVPYLRNAGKYDDLINHFQRSSGQDSIYKDMYAYLSVNVTKIKCPLLRFTHKNASSCLITCGSIDTFGNHMLDHITSNVPLFSTEIYHDYVYVYMGFLLDFIKEFPKSRYLTFEEAEVIWIDIVQITLKVYSGVREMCISTKFLEVGTQQEYQLSNNVVEAEGEGGAKRIDSTKKELQELREQIGELREQREQRVGLRRDDKVVELLNLRDKRIAARRQRHQILTKGL